MKKIVQGYLNTSFQSDIDDRKSQSGQVFTLNSGVVSWKNFKQETTINSTTKTEYISMFEVAKEAIQIKKFITKLCVVPSIIDLVTFYCDKNRAITQSKKPMSHQ